MTEVNDAKLKENELTPLQESWVTYWDNWYLKALSVGDMQGAKYFLMKSILIIAGIDVPETIAPAKPSISMVFENPNTYQNVVYSW